MRDAVTPDRLATERELQRAAVDLLRAVGWTVFKDTVAWRSDAGYPDLTCVHSGMRRVLWVEVKRTGGRLSPAQRGWQEVLGRAHQEWFCLTPAEWDAFVRCVVPPEMLSEDAP